MAAGLHNLTVQEGTNAALGQAGSILVSGTSAVTCLNGVFVAITMLEETVFTTLTAEDGEAWIDSTGTGTLISTSNGVATGSEAYPKGITIYGRWTTFTLASGLVVAYRG